MSPPQDDRIGARGALPQQRPAATATPGGERSDDRTVLRGLASALVDGRECIALVGPRGAGKTRLLHRFSEHVGRAFRCAHLPSPTLRPLEIRAWLEEFAGPLPADAGRTLEDLAAACARRGGGLVLLIDDAHAMPPDTAFAVGEAIARAHDALRVVLAGVDEPRFDAVLAAFPQRVHRIELRAAAPAAETPKGDDVKRTAGPPLATPSPATRPAARASFPMESDGGSRFGPPRAPASAPTPDRVAQKPARTAPRAAPQRAADPAAPHPYAPPRRADWQWPPIGLAVVGVAVVAAAFWVGRWSATEAPPAEHAEPPAVAVSVPPPPVGAPATAPPALLEGGERAPSRLAGDYGPEAVDVAAAPPAPEPVLVNVNARPWARIAIDGRDVGLTPLGNVPLVPGTYRFRAEMADGRVIERDVVVDAGRRRVSFP